VPERGGGHLALGDGARVAVVGGGPSGALFAYFLLRGVGHSGRRLAVTIYGGQADETRGFACGLSAGVLAQDFLSDLREAGIALPDSVIQRRITSFLLETNLGSVRLAAPGKASSVTVWRGPGPRVGGPSTSSRNFDRLLLEAAVAQGARVVPDYVRRLAPPVEPDGPWHIACAGQAEQEADLVVGACGLNSRIPALVAELGLGYRPPGTIASLQAELEVTQYGTAKAQEDAISVFMLNLPGVKFSSATPKDGYQTVTLVGESVGEEHLAAFLGHPVVRRRLLPDGGRPNVVCRCRPRALDRAASQPYADKLVLIGDAAASRLYKNGLHSALVTARGAATTALEFGVGRDDFARHYGPACEAIARDNESGRWLLRLYDRVLSSYPWLARRALGIIAREQAQFPPGRRPTCDILWHTLTGDVPYEELRRRVMSPRLYWGLLREGLAGN
jgi:flavin-dependent dehydrogenase